MTTSSPCYHREDFEKKRDPQTRYSDFLSSIQDYVRPRGSTKVPPVGPGQNSPNEHNLQPTLQFPLQLP